MDQTKIIGPFNFVAFSEYMKLKKTAEPAWIGIYFNLLTIFIEKNMVCKNVTRNKDHKGK
jgi:hypothetical protein